MSRHLDGDDGFRDSCLLCCAKLDTCVAVAEEAAFEQSKTPLGRTRARPDVGASAAHTLSMWMWASKSSERHTKGPNQDGSQVRGPRMASPFLNSSNIATITIGIKSALLSF